MKNGSIGDIEFQTSDKDVFTFSGMSGTSEIVFGEHDVLEGTPRLQHTGKKLDVITLPIVIDAMRPGAVPFAERFSQLVALAKEGEQVPLVLGRSPMGDWVILKVTLESTHQHGDFIISGTLSLELKEYN